MRWQPWGEYAKRCIEHKLAISKASVNGVWIYTLWKLISIRDEKFGATYQAQPDIMICNYESFDAAKAAAKELIENE